MNNRKILYGVAIAAVLAVVAVSIYTNEKPIPGSQKESVKIGAILPLTGNLAFLGEKERQGMELAVSEINATGGIRGKPLQVDFQDSKGEASRGVTIAQKFLNVDNRELLFTSTSGISNSVAPLVIEHNSALQVVFAMGNDIAPRSNRIFRIYPSIEEQGRVLVHAIRRIGPKRLRIIAFNNEVFQHFATKLIADELEATAQVDVHVDAFNSIETTPLRSVFTRVIADKPDMILFAAYYVHMPHLFRTLFEVQGTSEDVAVVAATVDAAMAVEQGLLQPSDLSGVIISAPEIALTGESSDSASTRARQFQDRFRMKFSDSPNFDAAFAYDAVHILASALAEVQLDQSAVPERLRRAEGWEGATGKISIDEDGNSTSQWTLGHYIGSNLVAKPIR